MAKRMTKVSKNFKWEECLREFLAEKRALGRSGITLSDYEYHVNQFYKRFPEAEEDVSKLKPNLYLYFSESIAPATYNLRLAYLKGFYGWCVVHDYLSENPLVSLTKRKAQPRIVNINQEILAKLIQMPDTSTYAGLRDKALLYLTLDTGIRPKEALRLLIFDFDQRTCEIIVPAKIAKTRTQRVLPLSQPTVSLIKHLINARSNDWDDSIPLFASCDGTAMHRGSWISRVQLYANELSVKIRPYDLRHVFALNYLRNNGNALFLQKLMGHADLSMTKQYIAASEEDIRIEHNSSSPLNHLIKPKRIRTIKR